MPQTTRNRFRPELLIWDSLLSSPGQVWIFLLLLLSKKKKRRKEISRSHLRITRRLNSFQMFLLLILELLWCWGDLTSCCSPVVNPNIMTVLSRFSFRKLKGCFGLSVGDNLRLNHRFTNNCQVSRCTQQFVLCCCSYSLFLHNSLSMWVMWDKNPQKRKTCFSVIWTPEYCFNTPVNLFFNLVSGLMWLLWQLSLTLVVRGNNADRRQKKDEEKRVVVLWCVIDVI